MTALAIMRLLPGAARGDGNGAPARRALNGHERGEMQSIRGRDIGMVFQEPMTALNPLMRIGDQVAETVAAASFGVTRRGALAGARNARSGGFEGEQGASAGCPTNCRADSGSGWRSRWRWCMAPPLLIADEPTTALDVITQAQVLLLLKDLARTRNMGLMLVIHDLAGDCAARRSGRRHAGGADRRAGRRHCRLLRHPAASVYGRRCWRRRVGSRSAACAAGGRLPVLRGARHRARISAQAALAVAGAAAAASGRRRVADRPCRRDRGPGRRVRLRQVQLAAGAFWRWSAPQAARCACWARNSRARNRRKRCAACAAPFKPCFKIPTAVSIPDGRSSG